MRNAAANLSSKPPPGLRDEIKRQKLLDLEFANEVMTGAGEEVDRAVPKKARAEARADAAERFRKGRLK
jgi:excinuclease ABC subunit B